jgi:outer membrane protein OmpA-like peptidoglycan-associated protein
MQLGLRIPTRGRASSALTATVVGALGALSLDGCATEDFVHQTVAPVQAQAAHAQETANTAQASAVVAQRTADDALARANAAHKLAEGRFLYEEILSDDAVKFPVGGDALSPEAQARLKTLADKLKADNRNVYVEIQGFTDAQGSARKNLQLGEARAESARRFLARQGVPLHRISTISYGEENPIAPNNTRNGRAQNRRIVVVVLG